MRRRCSHFFIIIFTVVFLLQCVFSREIYNSYSKNTARERVIPLIEKWAPKVWLHPQENLFPSNVSTFLKEVTAITKDGQQISSSNMMKIPTGKNSSAFFFVTNRNIDDLTDDPDSFIHGVNPSKDVVSVYAHIKACDSEYNILIVTYWFFYPFNGGKEVCTIFRKQPLPILKVFNKCLGKTRLYGNHVADWEHVSVKFENGAPTFMFLSAHNVGAFYSYDQAANSFILAKAKSKGFGQPQDPPDTVRLDLLGHPILYSARGSHGFWAGVGTHKYTKLNLRELSDATDIGTPWDTWRSIEVFLSDENTPDWFNFQGHWGKPGANCVTKSVCELSRGPRGLVNRPLDFDCDQNPRL